MRRLWAALLLALVTLAAASCSSLIGADEYEDSAGAICGMIFVCYGDDPACKQRVDQRLDQASSSVRSAWLTALTDESCLNTCTAARQCLDLLPVCTQGGACNKKEDCCGFLAGQVGCEPPVPGEPPRCCRGAGSPCDTDSDCCPSVEGGCSETFGTCGGVVCRAIGQSCVNSFDCCSGVCAGDGKCAESCLDLAFECTSDLQCCTGFCDPGSGRCNTPPCKPLGTTCAQNGDCCSEPANMQCVPVEDGTRFCMNETCRPPDVPCTRDDVCCSNRCVSGKCSKPCAAEGQSCDGDTPCCDGECQNGICQRACLSQKASCEASLDCCSGVCMFDVEVGGKVCSCSTDVCNTNENCCTGKCIGGACKPSCVPQTCNHSECQLGGPLGQLDSGGQPVPCPEQSGAPYDPACVQQVCAADEYCCCNAWDAVCVSEAASLCGKC